MMNALIKQTLLQRLCALTLKMIDDDDDDDDDDDGNDDDDDY